MKLLIQFEGMIARRTALGDWELIEPAAETLSRLKDQFPNIEFGLVVFRADPQEALAFCRSEGVPVTSVHKLDADWIVGPDAIEFENWLSVVAEIVKAIKFKAFPVEEE